MAVDIKKTNSLASGLARGNSLNFNPMKIKIPLFLTKINYLKYLPLFLIIIGIIIILFLANFLNKNYFQVQKNLKKIEQLSNEVTPVVVDIKTYQKILANLEIKTHHESQDLTPLKNPFSNIIEEKK